MAGVNRQAAAVICVAVYGRRVLEVGVGCAFGPVGFTAQSEIEPENPTNTQMQNPTKETRSPRDLRRVPDLDGPAVDALEARLM